MASPSDIPPLGGFGFAGSRAASAFARVRRYHAAWAAGPSWVHRVVGTLLLIILVGISAVLLVLGLLIGAIIAVVVGAVLVVRLAWARLTGQKPGRHIPHISTRTSRTPDTDDPPLDTMRENVRVIARE